MPGKTTGWGYFQQGSDQQLETDEIGSWLSKVIHCPVHYPAYGKKLYECLCGKIFPAYAISLMDEEAANIAKEIHNEPD
ncbi:MAG: hypothetical protein M0R06_00365 [Sphaerochaeta sp.]|nr:hypothetical protein [Sphaerochaeta sp.]